METRCCCIDERIKKMHQMMEEMDVNAEPPAEMAEEERFEYVSVRMLKEHLAAFKELAK